MCEVGCGSGRLAPYLASLGLDSRGIDLSPEMIRVARRDYPGHTFDVGDLRSMPYDDASLAGIVGWYSLMYLSPQDRPAAFAELARVVVPGGYLTMAFKMGDNALRRGGARLDLGVGFDIYWYSHEHLDELLTAAGFEVVFWAGRPAEADEPQPGGYLIARRT